jgi:hypothetical protein
MLSLLRCFLFTLSLIPLLLSVSTAQTFTGGIAGKVLDPNGAMVPKTSITLTNIETNEKRTMLTSEEGSFNFTAVPPGRYRLEVEQTGFKKYIQEPIEVRVQQFMDIPISLELGNTTEIVTVSGETQLIDPTTSSLGQVIENRQITELPLNGRNTLAFVELTPGIRDQGGFGDNPATVNVQAWGNFSANGGVANTNEVLVDGAPVTTVLFHGVGYMPPVDATQEFKVQTNNFSAEFGRTGGAVVNLSIKSGTNNLHGSIYEFVRNDKFDANDFFLNRAGQKRPTLRYNQFGASLGGPLHLPRFGEGGPAIINGRDRTFFFANYEGFRQREGKAFVTTVPTALERVGNFSQSRNANGTLRLIRDPNITITNTVRCEPTPANPTPGVNYQGACFPNGIIPVTRRNEVGLRLASALFPLPNTPGQGPAGINNYVTSAVQASDSNQIVLRIDHNVSNKVKLFGTYGLQSFDLGGWDPLGNRTTPIDNGRAEKLKTQHLVLSSTVLFSPTLIGEFRGSFTRIAINRTPMSNGFDLTSLGFPQSLQNAVQVNSFPVVTTSGFVGLVASTTSRQLRHNNTITSSGSLSFIRSSHTLKIGGQFRALGWNEFGNNSGSPTFDFNGQFTGPTVNGAISNASRTYGVPDMILGYPSSGFITYTEHLSLMRKYTALFVQDDWKIRPNLTLNAGLEWSVEFPFTERYNRGSWFEPSLPPPSARVVPQVVVENVPGIGTVRRPILGTLQFQDDNQRSPQNTYWKQFGPRIGLAYQVTSSTVVRAGYGLYWLPATAYWRTEAPTFYRTRQNYIASLNGGITPAPGISLSNPFPGLFAGVPGKSNEWDRTVTTLGGDAITTREHHSGYMQNWNFNIQQGFGKDTIFDIAYAGSRGIGLPAAINVNQLSPQYQAIGASGRTGADFLNGTVSNPFYGYVTTGPLSQERVSRAQLLRPFPQFDQVILGPLNVGNSFYHSMQVKLNKRFTRASLIGLAYTWSKTIDDANGTITAFNELAGLPGFTDAYNRRLERSLSPFDVPHRLSINYNLELPFGKGRRWLKDAGALTWLVSGWELNGIYTLQSGYPLFVSTQATTSLFATGNRPDMIKSAKKEGRAQERLQEWFDRSAFREPAAFTFGNASRTLPDVRTDGINNLDTGLVKNNRFGRDEQYNLQLRFESFNALNHVRFGYPGRVLGQSNFGVVNSQANKPRNIQLAMKFIF